MNFVSTSDVCRLLKAEIKAQTGKAVSVRKLQYSNVDIDCSKYPHLRSKIEEIVSHWRSGSMGMFDNFERNGMSQLENPATGCQVVWNNGAVEYENLCHLAFPVFVSYDYISVFGGRGF